MEVFQLIQTAAPMEWGDGVSGVLLWRGDGWDQPLLKEMPDPPPASN